MDRKLINPPGIMVRSEIQPLKKVLLHRPGSEIENLTPEFMERLLFDDIPWLEEAQREHDTFAQVLRDHGVEVVYLHELVADVLDDSIVKEEFIRQYIEESGVKNQDTFDLLFDYLIAFKDLPQLVRKTMSGIYKKELQSHAKKNLSDYVDDDYPFLTDPMPNLYFTRDPFASIGNKIALNKMYTVTRSRETIYAEYIFKYHPDYLQTEKIYERYYDFSIEGGDVLNMSNEVLAVGISQRTKAEAIEILAKELFYYTKGNEIKTILAFNIPKSRAYMHLDTVFTQVDVNKFTIHPQIKGPLEVYEIVPSNIDEGLVITRINLELEKILSKYLHIDDIVLIPCGGTDFVTSQREQWNDGSNTLAIRPGEVIVYSRNFVTNKLLQEHGIITHVIPSSELSRGRGGPRCMSMPLIRED